MQLNPVCFRSTTFLLDDGSILKCSHIKQREFAMKDKSLLVARYLIGVLLIVFGANKFFQFIPMQPMPEAAQAYMMGLGGAWYFFPLLGLSEVAVGLSFVFNKYVNLALLILAPIAINMVGFHLAFDIAGGIPAYFVFIGGLALGWSRCDQFKEVLKA